MFNICLLLFLFPFVNCERPEVQISLGNVAGYLKTSFGGKPFSAFEGIPYAKPPIGDLRFKVPEPIEPWTGTWNASTLQECIQVSMFSQVEGQEDCLYINIYVPNGVQNADVIVHVHGGSFKMGSGHSYTLPDYLMDKNVIFVSFNYRLDALGFLSTGDEVVSGNLGLWDQILALQWVQDNIQYFGGNPRSVTVTGGSAGAACSHLLYLSPTTEGLFQRGVSHSGTALNLWAIQDKKEAQDNAKLLGKFLGCDFEDSREMIDCLKERPAKSILEKSLHLTNSMISMPFRPVVDGGFLPKEPLEILQEDKIKDIPWIFSTTSQDGILFVVDRAEFMDQVNDNWGKYAKTVFEVDDVETLKDLYTGGSKYIEFPELVKIATDRFFTVDAERSAQLQAKSSPVYYYLFSFKGGSTFTDLVAPNLKVEYKGASHGDDVIHLYGNVLPNAKITDEDKEIIEIMTELLSTFAKNGIPKVMDVDWKPTGSQEISYLNISGPKQLTMETKKQIGEVEFWTK